MKIISGAQTGADRAALDVAIALGLDYGGSLPKGRLTEEGPLDPKYDRMTELDSPSYPKRTLKNVLDSDATLLFTVGKIRKMNEIIPYQVRNIDIFPTVLGIMGIPYSCEGVDLFPAGDGAGTGLKNLIAFGETDYSVFTSNPRRYIKGTAGKWRMARTNRWKLLFIPHPGEPIYEFYDLENDSSENNNLIDDPMLQAEIIELKKKLFEWIREEDLRRTKGPELGEMGPAARERLKSLGYL